MDGKVLFMFLRRSGFGKVTLFYYYSMRENTGRI